MRFEHPEYDRGNIYLSGGMQFALGMGQSWRSALTPKLQELNYYSIDIVALDRAYAQQYGEMYGPQNFDSHLQMKANFREHFVHTDLRLIEDHCDALIVLYDESARRGCGTQAECQHAYNCNIPVFLVSQFDNWEKEVPVWLQSISTKIFETFEELFDYLKALPYGILKKDRYGNHHDGNGNYLCFLSGEVFQKRKHHFVSTVSPLYSPQCVDLVVTTREHQADRYQFFVDALKRHTTEE